ncbi:MAG TPA: transposase [Steroidobacteraceae bacterium]
MRDKHARLLIEQARWVNFVWNYNNELSSKVLEREGRFLSGYDLHEFTRGATQAGLPLHSQTVQAVNEEYARRRRQAKKAHLRWRVSDRARSNHSLGWVPFKKSALRYRNGQVCFRDLRVGLWDSYGLSRYALGPGCFCEDSRGRWYLNVTVRLRKPAKPLTAATTDVGIDLGLKDLAATSEGLKVEAERFYRDLEPALAVAQRAGKKARSQALHAKIANRRKDFLHKVSTAFVRKHGAIFIGNVNASALAQSRHAKSILDAGWSSFRTMLKYKCDDAGAWFDEVDEAFSTQTCSLCSARSGPKGIAGLGMREWACGECGAVHDRDVNAARNILAAGRRRLAEGISGL